MGRSLSIFMGCILALGALVWPPLLPHAQEPVAKVMDVRMSHTQGRTRLVMDLDKPASNRWFTLPSPARVVVDFPQLDVVPDMAKVVIPQGSLVKALRAGNFRAGTTRMVVDLTAPARLTVFTIPGNTQRGPRLVIDVVPPAKGKPATDVPPPPEVVTTVPFKPGEPSTPTKPSKGEQQPAPVVPRQVVTEPTGPLVVVLDAGHGGVDPGACGRTVHLCEKGLTLEMAKLVKDNLEQKGGYKVLLSREKDVYVGLADRVKYAQRHNANLFVSLHADSHPDRDVQGATVYMVSERASDREAQRLANSENEGDILAGVDISHESPEVQSILMSLAQRNTINHSSYLAQSMITAMDKVLTLRKNTPLFAGFKVLKAPDIPSILVEMGYLTNGYEERRLNDKAHRRELAKVIANGIHAYVGTHVR
ncbi:MAG: N-acetylmuramoyl-L-alanine amidase [Alphaproteobacteria bacterium]